MLSVQITQFLIAKYGAKELLETIMRVKEDFKNLDEGLTKEHNEKVYLSQDSQTEEVIVKKILN